MKMTLNLTYEDGMKMVKAMEKVAIESGWEADELNDCGVIEEYSRVIGAALAAIGINLNIECVPSDENEDEEEDNDDNVVYSSTVKDDFIRQYMEAGYPFEEVREVADLLFGEGAE